MSVWSESEHGDARSVHSRNTVFSLASGLTGLSLASTAAVPSSRRSVAPGEVCKQEGYTVNWVDDDAVHHCMVCAVQFSFFNRKHHCRNCGKVVCHGCSPNVLRVRGLEGKQRVCRPCESQLLRDKRPRNPVPLFYSVPTGNPPAVHDDGADSHSTPAMQASTIARVVRDYYAGRQLPAAGMRRMLQQWRRLKHLPHILPPLAAYVQQNAGTQELVAQLFSGFDEPKSELEWLPLVGFPSAAARQAVFQWLDSVPECGWFWRDDAAAFVAALQRNLSCCVQPERRARETEMWLEDIVQRCKQNPPEMTIALYWAAHAQSLVAVPADTYGDILGELQQRLRTDRKRCRAIEQQLELFGDTSLLANVAKGSDLHAGAWEELVAAFSDFTCERPLVLPWGDQVSDLNAAGCKVWVDPDTNLGTVLLEFRTQHQQPTLLLDLDDDDCGRTAEEQPYRILYRRGVDANHESVVMRVAEWADRVLRNDGLDFHLQTSRCHPVGMLNSLSRVIPKSASMAKLATLSSRGVANAVRTYFAAFSPDIELCHDRLCKSAAGWFVVNYVLGVHNQSLDNLVLTRDGAVVPVGNSGLFQSTADGGKPLIPREILEVLGGPSSKQVALFTSLCVQALTALRKEVHQLFTLVSLLAGLRCGGEHGRCRVVDFVAYALHCDREEAEGNDDELTAQAKFRKCVEAHVKAAWSKQPVPIEHVVAVQQSPEPAAVTVQPSTTKSKDPEDRENHYPNSARAPAQRTNRRRVSARGKGFRVICEACSGVYMSVSGQTSRCKTCRANESKRSGKAPQLAICQSCKGKYWSVSGTSTACASCRHLRPTTAAQAATAATATVVV